MKLETNKILESLLKQHGITEFHPFEKPEKCDLDIQLYAYIKEDKFHICDADLKNYSRKNLNLPMDCPLVICIEDNTYAFRDIAVGKYIIISSDNLILDYEPIGFTEIGKDYFFLSPTVELPVQEFSIIGCLKNFKHNLVIDKPWVEYDVFDYSEKADTESAPELPKIKLGACLFIKNQLKLNLRYLFSQGCKHVFFNTKDQTFFSVHETSPNRHCIVNEYESDYIWISGSIFNFINFSLCAVDVEHTSEIDSIIVSCNGNNTEIKVSDGFTNIETINTEYSPYIEFSNEFFIAQYFNSTYYYHAIFCMVINRNGKFVFSRLFENYNVEFENNLIRLKRYNDVNFSLNDCYGNELARIYSEYEKYVKIEINNNRPSVFNEHDILLHHSKREEYKLTGQIRQRNDFETTYQGVLEQSTGRTMIPLNFSGVISKRCAEPFSEVQYRPSKQVSIVWIDHYFETERSYYGMFVEDKLQIPIFYDRISFLCFDNNEKHHQLNQSDTETNYVLVKHNHLYGLYSSWGKDILPIEAEYIELVGQNKNTKYVKAYCEDRIKLIYQDKVISGYDFLSAESIAGDKISQREEAVKISSEEGFAFIYKGCKRTSFYEDIIIRNCNIFSNDDHEWFVFIVTLNNLKGLLNSKGEVLIPIEHEQIEVQRSFVKVDGIIYGNNMTQIINTRNYEFVKGVKFNGTYVYLYKNESNVVLFGFEFWHTEVLKYDLDVLPHESEEIMGWKYNFENNEFEQSSEDDEYDYPDYHDDTDYDRDTYYALGGDDYDAFKERGGSLDDMMDGMGF